MFANDDDLNVRWPSANENPKDVPPHAVRAMSSPFRPVPPPPPSIARDLAAFREREEELLLSSASAAKGRLFEVKDLL